MPLNGGSSARGPPQKREDLCWVCGWEELAFDWRCTEFNILKHLIQFEVIRHSASKVCTSVLFQ